MRGRCNTSPDLGLHHTSAASRRTPPCHARSNLIPAPPLSTCSTMFLMGPKKQCMSMFQVCGRDIWEHDGACMLLTGRRQLPRTWSHATPTTALCCCCTGPPRPCYLRLRRHHSGHTCAGIQVPQCWNLFDHAHCAACCFGVVLQHVDTRGPVYAQGGGVQVGSGCQWSLSPGSLGWWATW